MSKERYTSLAKGYLDVGETNVFTASKETTIKFFPLTNKDTALQTFELWFNFAAGGKVPITPTISLYQNWSLHIIDDQEGLTMAVGDFITGFASVKDKISYLVCGRTVEYDTFGT